MQIFIHGFIYTGSETEWADALVIDGAGMILAVGSQEDLQRRFPNAITEDLNGQYLFPGFIDAHSHPAIFCREIRDPNFGNVRNWNIARSHIQEYIQAHPNRPWYVIFGWNEKKWGELTQDILDTVTTDHPLFIIHESNQKGVINSIGIETIHDTEKRLRHTNGVIHEQDFRRVQKYTFPSYDEILTLLPRYLRQMRLNGTTTVHDMLVMSIDQLHAYITLDQAGLLPLEVIVYLHESLLHHPDIETYLKYTGKHLTVAGIKVFIDGTVREHTALFHEPYSDGIGGTGLANVSEETMQEMIEHAQELGLRDIAFHAIGDAGVTRAIDMIESYKKNQPDSPLQFRIEHAEFVRPADYSRLHDLGIRVVVELTNVLDRFRYADRLGSRTKEINRLKDLREAGVFIGTGTEDKGITPMGAIAEAAKNDLLSAQRISIHDGFELFLSAGATLSLMDQFIGSLAPGKRADMMLLSGNPFERGIQLQSVTITQTWFSGIPQNIQ